MIPKKVKEVMIRMSSLTDVRAGVQQMPRVFVHLVDGFIEIPELSLIMIFKKNGSEVLGIDRYSRMSHTV